MKTKQLRHSTLVGAVIAGLAVAGATWAGTDTTTFTVSATVSDACSVTASNLDFGAYQPIAGVDTDATSTVTATCTLGTSYEIGLDAGSGTPGTTTRAMTGGGGDFLDYELYSDTSRSIVWTDLAGANPVAGTGTGLDVPHIVYGRIPAGQEVPADSYSDTINVTIEF